VLLIRPDAIGDFIVWSSSATAYQCIYPSDNFSLIVLGNPACEELALQMGIFDIFLPLDRKRFMLDWTYRFKKWTELNAITFDTIIYPTYSREFATGNLLVKRLKAAHKIGIKSDSAIDDRFWHSIVHKSFTQLFDLPHNEVHELIKNQAFVEAVGKRKFELSLPQVSSEHGAILQKFGLAANVDFIENSSSNKYFVLFPGARIALRQWPEANFAAIALHIYIKTGWQGILLGSQNEYSICERIKTKSAIPINNLAGKTSLIEMIALISKAKLFVGNETSGIHIAIAQKVPSVCVLGGGHFGRFMPYPPDLLSQNKVISAAATYSMPCFNCDWNCIYQLDKSHAVPCIEKISVEQVKSEVDRVLLIGLEDGPLT